MRGDRPYSISDSDGRLWEPNAHPSPTSHVSGAASHRETPRVGPIRGVRRPPTGRPPHQGQRLLSGSYTMHTRVVTKGVTPSGYIGDKRTEIERYHRPEKALRTQIPPSTAPATSRSSVPVTTVRRTVIQPTPPRHPRGESRGSPDETEPSHTRNTLVDRRSMCVNEILRQSD